MALRVTPSAAMEANRYMSYCTGALGCCCDCSQFHW